MYGLLPALTQRKHMSILQLQWQTAKLCTAEFSPEGCAWESNAAPASAAASDYFTEVAAEKHLSGGVETQWAHRAAVCCYSRHRKESSGNITCLENLDMSTSGPHRHEYVCAANAEVGVCLLDDLKKCPVELGEDLIAVFQLKANVVGLHPGNVLNTQHSTHK